MGGSLAIYLGSVLKPMESATARRFRCQVGAEREGIGIPDRAATPLATEDSAVLTKYGEATYSSEPNNPFAPREVLKHDLVLSSEPRGTCEPPLKKIPH